MTLFALLKCLGVRAQAKRQPPSQSPDRFDRHGKPPAVRNTAPGPDRTGREAAGSVRAQWPKPMAANAA